MCTEIRLYNMYVKKEDPDPDKRSDIKVHYKSPSGPKVIHPRPSLGDKPNSKDTGATTVELFVKEHNTNEVIRFKYIRTYVEWPGGDNYHGIVSLVGNYSSDGIATIEILHNESGAERPHPTTINVQVGGN